MYTAVHLQEEQKYIYTPYVDDNKRTDGLKLLTSVSTSSWSPITLKYYLDAKILMNNISVKLDISYLQFGTSWFPPRRFYSVLYELFMAKYH